MFSYNLPPALLAERQEYFMCYCVNMGMEWNDPRRIKFSHHSCRDLTRRNLLITSPALQPLSGFYASHFLYYYFGILNSLFDKLNVYTYSAPDRNFK